MWTRDPWGAAVEDGRMYGRGTLDMKGGLVAGLLAIHAVRECYGALPGDVSFESVIEEECTGNGTLAARRAMLIPAITVAAGVVFDSMRYVRGRRPPHAAERSARLLRGFRRQGLRAELLADLVSSAAALDRLTPEEIRRLAAAKLSVLPETDVDPAVIAAAARALQVEASRWARLRVGEELCYEWPDR